MSVAGDKLVIEHDVPLQRHTRRGKLATIGDQMKSGDSVVFSEKNTAMAFRNGLCRRDGLFAVMRRVGEQQWRVWCMTKGDEVGLPRVGMKRRAKAR